MPPTTPHLGTRICILGCSGAGKSTLARELGARLGLPVVHLDAHYWQPGWTPMPKDEWRETVARLAAGDRWIIDGNYGGSLDVRLAAADTVIFLDYPAPLCLWRVGARYLQYRGRTRPDLGPDCPEQIDWEFIRWIVHDYPRHSRPETLRKVDQHRDQLRVITLKSPRETRRFVAGLAAHP